MIPRPLLRLDFMIEIVGPRSVPAAQVLPLLTPAWQEPLGKPSVWVMAGADDQWQPLTPSATAGAFDSIVFTWRLLKGEEQFTRPAADHLLEVASGYAAQVQRRAMPIPLPQDVEARVRDLGQMRDAFDIGFQLYLTPRGASFRLNEVLAEAEALGLSWRSTGLWEKVDPAWPLPVFGLGSADGPLPKGAANQLVSGLDLGFHVPTSRDPLAAFEGVVGAAERLAQRLGADVTDDEDQPLRASLLRQNLEQAVGALRQNGVPAGSQEALALFGLL